MLIKAASSLMFVGYVDVIWMFDRHKLVITGKICDEADIKEKL